VIDVTNRSTISAGFKTDIRSELIEYLREKSTHTAADHPIASSPLTEMNRHRTITAASAILSAPARVTDAPHVDEKAVARHTHHAP
jgi:hypothetical protein